MFANLDLLTLSSIILKWANKTAVNSGKRSNWDIGKSAPSFCPINQVYVRWTIKLNSGSGSIWEIVVPGNL